MTRLSKRERNKLWAVVYKYPSVKKRGGIVKGQRRQTRESALNNVSIAPGGNAETSNISLRVGNGRHIHRGGKGRGAGTMSIKGKSAKTEGMGGKPNKYMWGTRLIYEVYMVPQDNDRLYGLFQAVMVERLHCEHQTRQGKSQWDGYLLISRSLNGELSGLAYRHACEESS